MQYLEVPLSEDGRARLDCYVPEALFSAGGRRLRPAIVIAPGGAYLMHAPLESEPPALRFMGMGYCIFVLRYHVYLLSDPTRMDGAPAGGAPAGAAPEVDPSSHYPVQVVDAMRAMAYVREHAAEWDIDASRVYAMGFSAGANVMGLLAERYDDAALLAAAGASAGAARPSGLVLCYPMVSAEGLCDGDGDTAGEDGAAGEGAAERPAPMPADIAALVTRALFGTQTPSPDDFSNVDLRRHVRADLPRTFVWQTAEDEMVSPAETTELVALMLRAGVAVEYHLFERGPHAMGLADGTAAERPGLAKVEAAEAAEWVGLCARWLALDGASE